MPEPFTIGSLLAVGKAAITGWLAKKGADFVKEKPAGFAGDKAKEFGKKQMAQFRENARLHLRQPDQSIPKALRLAYLQATLQVCALRGDELGANITSYSQHLTDKILRWKKRHDESFGVLAQAEVQWLDKLHKWLRAEITKAKEGKPPLLDITEQDLADLVPFEDDSDDEILRQRLFDHLIREIEQACPGMSDKFRSLLIEGWFQFDVHERPQRQTWFDCFCVCFQQALTKDPQAREIFQTKLLAGIAHQQQPIDLDQFTNALRQLNEQLAAQDVPDYLDDLSLKLSTVFVALHDHLNRLGETTKGYIEEAKSQILTSQDGLKKLIIAIQPSPKSVEAMTSSQRWRRTEQLWENYRQLLSEKVSKVCLLGEAESRELQKVFVELSISEEYQRPSARDEWKGFMDAELRERRSLFRYQPFGEREQEKQMIKPDELLREGTRAVVTGAPGCGKSTLMRWLAGKALHDRSHLVPVFLELKSITKEHFKGCRGDLAELLFERAIAPLLHFEHLSGRERLKVEFLSLLAEHQVLIFLDGLDEVRNTKFFRPLCDSVNHFIASDYGRNLLIISTRPYALDMRFQNTKEMEIAPLNQRQVAEFLHNYYDDDPKLNVSVLIRKLRRRELADMIRVPVLLGAMVRRYREKGEDELTSDRLKLYEGLVRDLAVMIDREKNVCRYKFNDEEGRRNLKFLERVAFNKLFAERVDADIERLTFNGDWILVEAKEFCAGSKVDPFDFAADVKATPLLREVAEDVWAFSHLTIQEYLAAKVLVRKPDCKTIFFRAYFNPTLVKMEALPMALGLSKTPDDIFRAIEQLPDSLNFAGVRLRARGLAYGAVISRDSLDRLVDKLIDFIKVSNIDIEKTPYSDAVIHAYEGISGSSLHYINEKIYLLWRDNESRVRLNAAEALGKIGGEAFLPALHEALKDEDSHVRRAAVTALRKIGGESSVPVLRDALKDDDISVRMNAAEALKEIGGESSVSALRDALKNQYSAVRRVAAEALGKIGGEASVPALSDALKDDDIVVRRVAAEALGKIGAESSVLTLRDALKDKHSDVRRVVAAALREIGGESSVLVLVDALKDEDTGVRRIAAEALKEIGSESFVPALREALKDNDSGVRRVAAEALGNIGGESSVPDLLAALKDEDSDVRRVAVAALRGIGESLFPDLLDALKDGHSHVRLNAAAALGKIGRESSVPALNEALKDKDSCVRRVAAEALGKIGVKTSVPALSEALKDADTGVRLNAAAALAEIGGESSVPALREALKDEDFGVRLNAAAALGKIGGESSVPALSEALKDEDNVVRRVAAAALGKVGVKTSVAELLDALKDKDSGMRRVAAEALGKIGGESSVPALSEALKDKDSGVRRIVAEALKNISSRSSVPALLAALKDEDSGVRRVTAEALKEIGGESSVPALRKALKNDDSVVRRVAAEALKEIGSESSVPALLAALKDKNGYVRRVAAEALGKIGCDASLPALREALKDEYGGMRLVAAEALKEVGGESSVPALLAALKNEDHEVCRVAAEALKEVGGESSVPALREALKDNHSGVRRVAAEALRKIGSESSVPALLAALKDKDSAVRQSTTSALEEMKPELLTNGLLFSMSYGNNFVRKKAAEVSGYYSVKRAEENLKRLADNDLDPTVKQAATNALTQMVLRKQYLEQPSFQPNSSQTDTTETY